MAVGPGHYASDVALEHDNVHKRRCSCASSCFSLCTWCRGCSSALGMTIFVLWVVQKGTRENVSTTLAKHYSLSVKTADVAALLKGCSTINKAPCILHTSAHLSSLSQQDPTFPSVCAPTQQHPLTAPPTTPNHSTLVDTLHHPATMHSPRQTTSNRQRLLLATAMLHMLSCCTTTSASQHQWAYEGNVHPLDSKVLRWQEAYWESKATLEVPSLNASQMLVVLITTTVRLPLVLASREWRRGLVTMIVSDRLLGDTEYEAAFKEVGGCFGLAYCKHHPVCLHTHCIY